MSRIIRELHPRHEGAFLVAQSVYSHTWPNGLTLLAERMEHVRSAAINFLLPAGCAFDPPNQSGLATVLSEMITRGAGDRDSRALSLALDDLGLDRDEAAGMFNMRLFGSTLARNIPTAMELYADIIRRAHLPEDELEPIQMLAIQDLQALEDSPQQKVMVELRSKYYPHPLNLDRRGTPEGIRNLTIDAIRSQYEKLFCARGTIISVAGNIEWEPLRKQVDRLFGDWAPGMEPNRKFGPNNQCIEHITKDTNQTQIAMAWKSAPIGDADYYAARGAANVLSGGMSARLFTEVREKRGLCYSIQAFHETFRDRASMLVYAGTRTERAQETLDVTLAELRKLPQGIDPDEIARVQAGLKSALIMQDESTSARAGALASDWYYLGRVRTLDEIQASIDALTPKSILEHLERYPARDFTVVTLGKSPLNVV